MNVRQWLIIPTLPVLVALVIVFFFTSPNESDPFVQSTTDVTLEADKPMNITSPAFSSDGIVPTKYTCDGENVSPPLTISDIPQNAKSLAIIMDDPDIPESLKESRGIDAFVHWVSYNIPIVASEISEATEPGTTGLNSRGTEGYIGPCPPDREHRYFFKLYALDSALILDKSATKQKVTEAMEGHIVETATLMGRYDRKR